ncbi:MAG TPA: M13 family metallopeptidase [Rhizomicrobium sp.]|jgi:putative endopeptidase|nr:M13 family metallopeptidase [Rhizomicrobium sp.]
MSRIPAPIFLCVLLGTGSIAFAQDAGPQFGRWGVDLSAMDDSVKSGDNFFLHVNGKWLKTAVIPPDRTSTGSFQDLQILSETRLKSIVDDLEAHPEASLSAEERKLRDLYDAFEDTGAIEAAGVKPVQKDLDYLNGLQTLDDVARAMASVPLSTESVYNIGIGVDDKNPDNYSINLSQSGLGMPDREFYLSDSKEMVTIREAYRKYLTTMMDLAGVSDAPARADRILALETEIAKVQWSRADRRDEDKVYNPMPVSALKTLAPDFAWDAFLAEDHVPLTTPQGHERYVIVAEKSAFEPLAAIFKKTPVSVWRDYLIVHYLHTFAPYLPKKFDDANFAFYGTVLGGQPQQLDRKTRGVHLLDNLMGEALGKLYVARYFPPVSKAKADLLVSNLLKAFQADLQTLSWMSPQTRIKALEKIHEFTPKIGYPTKWRDYSAYEVVRGDLIGDVQRASLFEWNRELKRINQPVDKAEWDMTPSTINAYYNPSFNEIVFPAAILQPPFFDPKADDAVNYGAIGAVIGHEISHGFDDQGSKYDGKGVFQNWWTPTDRTNFDARTTALVNQYDSYEPLPGLHVIGKNTLGENIADNAGLAIALKAYHISLDGKPAPVLHGYTGDQRFYLSYGQVWRSKMRDSAVRTQTLSNEHTVPEFRVIGTTRNQDEWYNAFDVEAGQKYYLPPDQRVHLW